jgi:ATP-dependent Clp protease ATP-binding subunit ClpX
VMGFNAKVQSKKERKIGEILEMVEPEDLIKFGMIPEFSGRIPVVATLDELSRDDLVRILLEPRNAVIRQYQKLFELENVNLRFQDEAIDAIADLAVAKETGARGLRTILEEIMLDVMFDIPSRKDIRECVIKPGVVFKTEEPLLVYEHDEYSEEDESDESALA